MKFSVFLNLSRIQLKKERKPAINFTAVPIIEDDVLLQLKVMNEEKAKKEAEKEEKKGKYVNKRKKKKRLRN